MRLPELLRTDCGRQPSVTAELPRAPLSLLHPPSPSLRLGLRADPNALRCEDERAAIERGSGMDSQGGDGGRSFTETQKVSFLEALLQTLLDDHSLVQQAKVNSAKQFIESPDFDLERWLPTSSFRDRNMNDV
jgi:hypothetical protein